MTYDEAVEYLYNSVPLFQNVGAGAYKEGLSTTLLLDEHFGHPHLAYKTIHIGGTNGKGSCSHTIAAILQEAGYKVGLYTSPHLIDFRERIRINGKMIPQERVVSFVKDERSFFEPLHPSFFELTTALAFKYFAEQKVDIAVIEVGLGGRLDCTNIISPALSIITNISFDHVQFLGDTLEKIAYEKAGIIKNNIPIIIGETTEETKPVFVTVAKAKQAKIRFANEEKEILGHKRTASGLCYNTKHYGTIEATLSGECQIKNTSTIICAVDELISHGFQINENHIKNGFSKVCELTNLQGRWQKIAHKPTIICDTGHNVAGIEYIVKQLKEQEAKQLHIVMGMVNDKDVNKVLSLLPPSAHYYFTKASVKRALNENELSVLASHHGLTGCTYKDVPSAYKEAIKNAHEDDLIFIGGSTFIVADFLAFLGR